MDELYIHGWTHGLATHVMEECEDGLAVLGLLLNQLSGFFTEDCLLVLSPLIRHHTDVSVTFADVTSTKNKVQLKK